MVRHPRGRYIVKLVAVSGVATPEHRFGKIVRRVMVYWPQEEYHERNTLRGADDP